MTLLRPPLGRLSSLTLAGDEDDGQDAVMAVVEELLPRSPSEQEGGEEQGPPPWLLKELVLKDCTVLAARLLSDHRECGGVEEERSMGHGAGGRSLGAVAVDGLG